MNSQFSSAIAYSAGKLCQSVIKKVSLLILSLCCITPLYAQTANQLVILQYHHISSSTPPSTSTSLADFRQHMEYLRDNNFQVLALEDALERLQQGQRLPDKSVAITFDDGFKSIYEQALPLLADLQWPFTVFITSNLIRDNSRLYMNWQQVNELAAAGATIANHTLNHPYLITAANGETESAWIERVSNEITQAEADIYQHTGQSHRLLAYPYGEYNMPLKTIVTELGYIGIAQHSGPVNASSDFAALPRFPVGGIYAGMNTFVTKVNSLAFSQGQISPASPITSSDSPSVVFSVADGNYRHQQFSCYHSNERMSVIALDTDIEDRHQYRIETAVGNQSRRFRYNCTAPASSSDYAGQYYWYSIPWINPTINPD